MNRAIFRLFALLSLSVICVAAKADDATYPKPSYGGFGVYGYKLDKEWKIAPVFKQAKPFNDGLAAVSFDGKKYALMNQFGAMVTDFIFDTPPTKFSDGMAEVTNSDGTHHFINMKGEKISPDFSFINRFGPLIIASPDKNNYYIYDYNFKPITDAPFKSITLSITNFEDETARCPIAETHDGYRLVLDWQGRPIMPDRYSAMKQMWHYTQNNKGLKKAFDNGFFKGGENILAVVQSAANGQFGIASLAGTEVVPCTYPTEKKLEDALKKLTKDKLIPYLRRNGKNDVATFGDQMNKSREQLRTSNLASANGHAVDPQKMETVKFYCSIVESAGKKSAKGKAGKTLYLSDNYKPQGDPFSSLEQLGYYFVGTKTGEKGQRLYNIYGMPLSEAYDQIKVWGFNNNDMTMFQARRDGKWGLMNCVGEIMLPIEYDNIESTSKDSEIVAARRGDKEYIVNGQTGKLLSTTPYDDVFSVADKEGLYKVSRLGYETKVDAKGNEKPSIPEVVFNQIEALPRDSYDKRIEGYKKCIALCGDADRQVLGSCWNNMGAMYVNKGDAATARSCYEKAASYGNQTAKSNLAAMKQQDRQEKINAVGDFLNTLNQAVNTFSGGGGTTGGGTYSGSPADYSSGSTGGASAPSTSGNGKDLGLSTYQSLYSKWENNAKSNYDSLTRAGATVKKNGKDVGGTAAGAWRPQNYTGLKQNLRHAQSEMRKIRQEARRYGHNIPQSNYETVTVSY